MIEKLVSEKRSHLKKVDALKGNFEIISANNVLIVQFQGVSLTFN